MSRRATLKIEFPETSIPMHLVADVNEGAKDSCRLNSIRHSEIYTHTVLYIQRSQFCVNAYSRVYRLCVPKGLC
jgi:hypothetical protein